MSASPSPEDQAVTRTLEDVRWLVMARSFQTAAKRMGELRHHLEEQLDIEGRLVPIFIGRTGDPAGVVPRLRREHDRLAARVEETCAAISQWNSARALFELDRLAHALGDHHDTADELLHPALDDLVPEDVDWESLHYSLAHSS